MRTLRIQLKKLKISNVNKNYNKYRKICARWRVKKKKRKAPICSWFEKKILLAINFSPTLT